MAIYVNELTMAIAFKYLDTVLNDYRKIPNISPGVIEVRKHFLGGLYSEGGLYSDVVLC